MYYRVIELRRDGVRLTRDEIAAAAPVVGDLQISDWQQGNAEKRILRRGQLLERTYSVTRSIIVLFEPTLIRMTGSWFVLRGWQVHSADGVVRQYAQEWLVRPAEQGSVVSAGVERAAVPSSKGYS